MNSAILLTAILVLLDLAECSPARQGRAKIVGGHEAEPHAYPYQVSIQKKILWRHSHTCGGSILNADWILTAGHCISTSLLSHFIPLDVFAGIHSVKGKERSAQIIRVSEKYIHPDYKGDVNPNDIAVLRLERSLTFNKFVQPIALPQPDTTPLGPSTLTGWGLLKSSPNSKIPEYLQTIDLPIITFKECNDSINELNDGEGRNPLDEMSNVCTGPLTGGISACNGDSGGPLVQREGNNTVQVGIVSWGYNPCGTKGAPSVYTKVSSFLVFITEHFDQEDD